MSQYEPFPTHTLPVPVRRFVEENSRVMFTDGAMTGLPALATLASAIGLTRQIEARPGYCEPPIVWTCLIARSGSAKTPAAESAVRPLANAEHRAQIANRHAEAEYEKARLKHEKELSDYKRGKGGDEPPPPPERPKHKRFICDDATLESLVPLIEDNPRGLLIYRDELAGFFNSHNQYKSGGRGSDSQSWLQLNRAGALHVDRKNGGRFYVARAGVSITGTVQPEVFAKTMLGEHTQSGMLARFLIAKPDLRLRLFTTESVSQDTKNAYQKVVTDLTKLDFSYGEDGAEPITLRMNGEARARYGEWYNINEGRVFGAGNDAEAAAFSKQNAYCLRFALIFALCRDPYANNVTAHDVDAACELTDWFGRETLRIYGFLAEDDETREERELIELIERCNGRITARDLRLKRQGKYLTSGMAEAALDAMAARDLGKWSNPAPGPKGGRPSRVFILNSPQKKQSIKTETPGRDSNNGGFGFGCASSENLREAARWESV